MDQIKSRIGAFKSCIRKEQLGTEQHSQEPRGAGSALPIKRVAEQSSEEAFLLPAVQNGFSLLPVLIL